MLLLGLVEFLCLIGFPVTLVGLIIQAIRKRPNKKKWAIAFACFLITIVVCIVITPTDSADSSETKKETEVAQEDRKEERPQETVDTETEEVETQSEAEKFAERNNIPVKLAESLETVLAGMELTDSSRVGVFHYNLSHVYEWKQIDDWAEGERYSAYMDMEHVWYIYVKNSEVVGIRDGHGNVFYTVDN